MRYGSDFIFTRKSNAHIKPKKDTKKYTHAVIKTLATVIS